MAAEGSTAWFTLSSYRQMGKKSRPWGAAEIQCTQCGRRVSRVSGEDVEGEPLGPCPALATCPSPAPSPSGCWVWRVSEAYLRTQSRGSCSVGGCSVVARLDGNNYLISQGYPQGSRDTHCGRSSGLRASPKLSLLCTCFSSLFIDSFRGWCMSSLEHYFENFPRLRGL